MSQVPDNHPPHALIAGFGLCGRFVAELLDFHSIFYSVVDLNPTTAQRCKNVPVIVGDVREEAVLRPRVG